MSLGRSRNKCWTMERTGKVNLLAVHKIRGGESRRSLKVVWWWGFSSMKEKRAIAFKAAHRVIEGTYLAYIR